jgi:hypothetical protein
MTPIFGIAEETKFLRILMQNLFQQAASRNVQQLPKILSGVLGTNSQNCVPLGLVHAAPASQSGQITIGLCLYGLWIKIMAQGMFP